MESPIHIPDPSMKEERRLNAEVIRDTMEMVELVEKNANLLLPGDSTSDFWRAWDEQEGGPRKIIHSLALDLLPSNNEDRKQIISDEHLKKEGLIGASGRLKRNHLSRLRDHVRNILRPDENMNINLSFIEKKDVVNGSEALAEYFEGSITFFKSLCGSDSRVEEILSVCKQLSKLNAKAISVWMKDP